MPGRRRGECGRRLTSGASGTLRVWTARMAARPLLVRRVDHDRPVEPPGSQQRGVEDVGPIRGGQDDHAFVAREAVHLGQDLVERLLALVVTAERPRPARAVRPMVSISSMKMIAGATLRASREQFAHAARADADDHLDELAGARAEERERSPRRRWRGPAAFCRFPAGPDSSTPFGARAPRRRYLPGSFRKSTTSLISASTSSIPATSSKVTRTVSGSTRFARASSEKATAHRARWRLNIQT